MIAGLFFSTYEHAKTVIGATFSLHESLVHSSASAVAEMASCLVLAPAEVVKQNAQMLRGGKQQPGPSSSLRALRQLVAAPRNLFSGYTALVARNLPFTALQFPMFERLRSWMWQRRRGGESHDDSSSSSRGKTVTETGLIAGASAGLAGAVAAWVTTPSDVVKTRMALTAGQDGGAGGRRATAWAVARMVYQEKGARGFFRGALFRSGWTAVGSSLYLGTYDAAKLWLRRAEQEDSRIL